MFKKSSNLRATPDAAAPTSVATRLFLMALALVVPAILLLAALAITQYAESERRFSTQLIAMTRALSLATEREIGQGQSVLQGLAVSPALAAGDLVAFEAQARRVTQARTGWIVLIGPDGQRLNTLLEPGARLPQGLLPQSRWAAIRNGQVSVSDLTTGTVAGGRIIAIDMPVLVEGKLHALSYIQRPAAFSRLLAEQGLPPTWTGAIVDRGAALVARSRDQDRMLGRLASKDMRAAMARSHEGVVRTRTLDGVKTVSAFSTSAVSGWTFIVGVPREELAQATLQSIALIAGASALMIVLGAAAAIVFAQPISRDVRGLVAEARYLASGQAVGSSPARLTETLEVSQSLQTASATLRARDREVQEATDRQQLMINELNHRVKNTLVIVQSLARNSLRDPGPESLGVFNERLHALARAHDLLTRRIWEGADLREVLEETLQPYPNRTQLDGPPVPLSPNRALALAMIFHELATNASKYGGLSTSTGMILVTWSLVTDGVEIVWREMGGPPTQAPTRTGFGSRLITASLKGELGGVAQFDYRPTGLVCRIVFTSASDPGPSPLAV